MNYILHRADSRGHANHGWLTSYHTFSFANYYNPERINFGVLRVLNDDTVVGGRGFATHPHEDMEIISIPLEGALEHRDSMGNTAVIRAGDIQVMSAGTGVYHSEKNKNLDQPVKFLQIWILPNKKSVAPRYDQITIDREKTRNTFLQILSPNPNDAGVWIHQNAWFFLGNLDKNISRSYALKDAANGVYIFVLNGKISIADYQLEKRDGLAITDSNQIEIKAIEPSAVLLMEVPMVP